MYIYSNICTYNVYIYIYLYTRTYFFVPRIYEYINYIYMYIIYTYVVDLYSDVIVHNTCTCMYILKYYNVLYFILSAFILYPFFVSCLKIDTILQISFNPDVM